MTKGTFPGPLNLTQLLNAIVSLRLTLSQVIRMLEEPTAAALAFGLHRKPDVNHILVYDLGGGTLDVSVLFVNDGSVDVIGSDGDDNLGGKFRRKPCGSQWILYPLFHTWKHIIREMPLILYSETYRMWTYHPDDRVYLRLTALTKFQRRASTSPPMPCNVTVMSRIW